MPRRGEQGNSFIAIRFEHLLFISGKTDRHKPSKLVYRRPKGFMTENRLDPLLEDRTRIGRELHCVLQSLYAIGLNVETAQQIRSNQPVEAKESNDKTIRQINQLIHEVRGLIRELESGTPRNSTCTPEPS